MNSIADLNNLLRQQLLREVQSEAEITPMQKMLYDLDEIAILKTGFSRHSVLALIDVPLQEAEELTSNRFVYRVRETWIHRTVEERFPKFVQEVLQDARFWQDYNKKSND
jgi:hypothetical protein